MAKKTKHVTIRMSPSIDSKIKNIQAVFTNFHSVDLNRSQVIEMLVEKGYETIINEPDIEDYILSL